LGYVVLVRGGTDGAEGMILLDQVILILKRPIGSFSKPLFM
jgi:hypothetical protein